MNLHEIATPTTRRRQKRRVGRGHGSGRVKTSGRGTKGQNSRAGGGTKLHFEGGQNPWTMRVPHSRGFNIGRFRKHVQVLNLRDLEERFEDGATVNLATLRERGLIDDVSGRKPVKLLGEGSLTRRLEIEVHSASRTAQAAVAAAGGSLHLLRQPAASPDADESGAGDGEADTSEAGEPATSPAADEENA